MENTTLNTTLNSATADDEVKALIQQGYEKSKEFSLIFLGATIISDSRTLSNKVTAVQGGDNGKYDLVAKVKLLKNESSALELFKREAVALCEQNGIKSEGQALTYLIPNALLKETLKGILKIGKDFNQKLAEICQNYDSIRDEIEQKFNQITDDKVRTDALAKIPTKEDFIKRNFFKPNVFPTGGVEETDPELKQLIAETKAKNATSTEEAFLDKAFKPFRDVFDDVQSNIKNNAKFKADEIGRKRSAIGRAIKRVLNVKTCLDLVFRTGESKDLLDKLFALLPVIYDRFGDVDAKNPVKGSTSETEAVKIFYAILDNLKSAEDFKQFTGNGGNAAQLLGYFDIRNIKGGKKQPAAVIQQRQLLGNTPELTREECLKGVEYALEELSDTFTKTENNLESTNTDSCESCEEQTQKDTSLEDVFRDKEDMGFSFSVEVKPSTETSVEALNIAEQAEMPQEQVVEAEITETVEVDAEAVDVVDAEEVEVINTKVKKDQQETASLTASDIYDSLGL